MNIKGILKAGMILMVLGFALNIIGLASATDGTEELVDDIEEYDGSVGPENALYGLKLAFENIDESFTWNASEKLGKMVSHSRLRISEAKAELRKQNNEAAEKAFEHYREKVKETEESISDISGTDSGIFNAQIMIEKHGFVLENLSRSHPNNTGLQNAYNRSMELREKFALKTERKIERILTSEGKHILREIKKEDRKDDRKYYRELIIKAGITQDISQVELELKFEANSTDNATIARDILNELNLTRENISRLLDTSKGNEDQLKETLIADAQIRKNFSEVQVRYKFSLNASNKTQVIDGIFEKLSGLTLAKIQDVLNIKVNPEFKKENNENILKVMDTRKDVTPDKRENKTENEEERRETGKKID
jgi:hypothetical protein